MLPSAHRMEDDRLTVIEEEREDEDEGYKAPFSTLMPSPSDDDYKGPFPTVFYLIANRSRIILHEFWGEVAGHDTDRRL